MTKKTIIPLNNINLGNVSIVVGNNSNCGDADGTYPNALLNPSHDIINVPSQNVILLADSSNYKIRMLDLQC